MSDTNENCLNSMKCPRCSAREPFSIYVVQEGFCEVFDEGTEDIHGPVTWDNDSRCNCIGCGQEGTVGDFTEPTNDVAGEANMHCPDCASTGPFKTESEEEFTPATWAEEASCSCQNCSRTGVVSDFIKAASVPDVSAP